LDRAALVGGDRSGSTSRRASARRSSTENLVQQARGLRPRRARAAPAPGRQRREQTAWDRHVHPVPERAGRIECDLTVTRVSADRFMLVTAAPWAPRSRVGPCPRPGRRHRDARGCDRALRVLTASSGLDPARSRARDADDVSDAALPVPERAPALDRRPSVLALRVTLRGELGWEMYVARLTAPPCGSALASRGAARAARGGLTRDRLAAAGKGHIAMERRGDAGAHTAGAGSASASSSTRASFIGRERCGRRRRRPHAEARCLTLADPRAIALGGEPIRSGDAIVRRVTSGGYGYTVGASIAYGYDARRTGDGRGAARRRSVRRRGRAPVSREPLYDPRGQKIKEVVEIADRNRRGSRRHARRSPRPAR